MAITPTLARRTSVPGRSPTPGSLQPGQLAVEMNTPTRLWVGVPLADDANQQKLLLDTSVLAGVTVADAPPAAPAQGALWWDSLATQLFVSYNDGTSQQWVQANSVHNPTTSLPYLPLVGGTLTGPLVLAGNAATPLQAVPLQQLQATVMPNPVGPEVFGRTELAAWEPVLPLAGGILTGELGLASTTGSLNIHMRRPAGMAVGLLAYTGTLSRWSVDFADNAAESGANAGSNFIISRYSDLGAFIDRPLSINRATGIVDFAVPPTVLGAPVLADAPSDTFFYGRKDATWVQGLPLTGGTVSGPLNVNGSAQFRNSFYAKPNAVALLGFKTTLAGGDATAAGGAGGELELAGGAATNGGALTINGGSSNNPTLGTGGGVQILGGSGIGAGLGGGVTIGGGAGGTRGNIVLLNLPTAATADLSAVWNNGVLNIGAGGTAGGAFLPLTGGQMTGDIIMSWATNIVGSPGTGGTSGTHLTLAGGSGDAASSPGEVRITGGTGLDRGSSVVVRGGGSGTGSAGEVVIEGGVSTGSSGGQIFITGGKGVTNGSNVIITGGVASVDSQGGQVQLVGGAGQGIGAGGNVALIPGVAGATGVAGSIIMSGLPTAASANPNTVWNNAGVLNIGAGGSGGGGLADAPVDTFFYGRKDATWVQGLPLTGGTLTGPLRRPGFVDGNVAGTGEIGEYLVVPAVPAFVELLTDYTAHTVATLSLPPGEWLVWGNSQVTFASTVAYIRVWLGPSQVEPKPWDTLAGMASFEPQAGMVMGAYLSMPAQRISVTAATPIYISAACYRVAIVPGSDRIYGQIYALRMR